MLTSISLVFLLLLNIRTNKEDLGYDFDTFTTNDNLNAVKERLKGLLKDVYYSATVKNAKQDLDLIINFYNLSERNGFYSESDPQYYQTINCFIFITNLFTHIKNTKIKDNFQNSMNSIDNEFESFKSLIVSIPYTRRLNADLYIMSFFLFRCNELITYKEKTTYRYTRICNSIIEDNKKIFEIKKSEFEHYQQLTDNFKKNSKKKIKS